MWEALLLGGTFVLSLALGLYLTPLVRTAAVRFNVLDRADGDLKQQREPVPYLGGIAIYLTFLMTLALVFEFEPALLGLLLGGTLVTMLGLFDDLRVLPPRIKFGGQLLACWVVIKSGILIELTFIPEWLAVPLTVIWLVGMTNAFNIIDVSDGLSGGVAAVAGSVLFLIALLHGDRLIAITTLALVAAILAFLRFNWPPARMYLGDTGSLFIGFMLGALAMIGRYTERHPLALLAPLLILSVPLLDTTLVSVARIRRGRSPFQGSPDHFAIRLRQRGWSAKSIALYGIGLGVVGGVGGGIIPFVGVTTMSVLSVALLLFFAINWLILWRLKPRAPGQETISRMDATEGRRDPSLLSAPSPTRHSPPTSAADSETSETTDRAIAPPSS